MTFLWMSRCGIQYLFIEEDDDDMADGNLEVKRSRWTMYVAFFNFPPPRQEGAALYLWLLQAASPPKPSSSKGLFTMEGAFGSIHPVASAPCLYELHRLIHLATDVRLIAKLVDGTVAVSGWVEPPPHWLVPQPMLSASLFRLARSPSAPPSPWACETHTTPGTDPQLLNFHFHGCRSPSEREGGVLDIASLSRASFTRRSLIGRHPYPILISHVSGSMARYGFRILDSMQPCQLAWRRSKLGLVFVSGYRESRRSHHHYWRVSGGGKPCSGHDRPLMHEMRSAAVVMPWGVCHFVS
jgi:hypothetical protein